MQNITFRLYLGRQGVPCNLLKFAGNRDRSEIAFRLNYNYLASYATARPKPHALPFLEKVGTNSNLTHIKLEVLTA